MQQTLVIPNLALVHTLLVSTFAHEVRKKQTYHDLSGTLFRVQIAWALFRQSHLPSPRDQRPPIRPNRRQPNAADELGSKWDAGPWLRKPMQRRGTPPRVHYDIIVVSEVYCSR